jgi:hypothetical protein
MVRLVIPTGMSFDEFRRGFEAAAPAFDIGPPLRVVVHNDADDQAIVTLDRPGIGKDDS